MKLLEKLKLLTNEQLIDIANIIQFNDKWEVVKPKHKWNGIDIVFYNGDVELEEVIQIDLNENIKDDIKRFKYFDNGLYYYPITEHDFNNILEYLKKI